MIRLFRSISLLEGVSLLILLFVAMPLKYIWGNPEYVRVVGMAHGLLFIAYIIFAIMTKFKLNWKIETLFIVFIASIIPFGTFYIDKKYLSN
jgi:integral membrane protein